MKGDRGSIERSEVERGSPARRMSVVSEQDLLDVVRDAVALVMTVAGDGLTSDTELVEDLGVDSLALIEIVESTEERLRAQGISVWVDDETLAALAVVGDLVAALRAAGAR